MDASQTYYNPLGALLVSYQRLSTFTKERWTRRKLEKGSTAYSDLTGLAVSEVPRYWTSLPLRRAIWAVPLLPTLADPSSICLSPGVPLSPVFINLDHVRVFSYAGFLTGLMVGGYNGGRLRRLQFLAENSHRLPSTKAGWYFYLRERNFQVLKKAGAAGVRMGAKWGAVLGGFAAVETMVDVVRAGTSSVDPSRANLEAGGDFIPRTISDNSSWTTNIFTLTGAGADSEDWKSTAIAGLITQLVVSRIYSLRLSPRMIALGLASTSLLGLTQDAFRNWYGESSKYTYTEIIQPDDAEDPVAAALRKKEEEERRKQKGKKEEGGWEWPWAPKEVGAVGGRRD